MADLLIGGDTFKVEIEGSAGNPTLVLSNSLGAVRSMWDVPKIVRRTLRLGLASWFSFVALTAAFAAEFHIGVAVPLSGSDAIFGNQVRLGVNQAVADANASGGFLGRRAIVDPRDDASDPKKAVDVARAFVVAKTPVVIGDFSSAATVPASAILAEAGVLDISPSALAPAVTERGLPTVFRMCGRDDQQAEAAAGYLVGSHLFRVAILHDRTGNGKEFADGVRKVLGRGGVRDVFYGSLEQGSRDFSGLAGRIKASGAQAVVFGGSAAEAGLLARQLRDVNAHVTFLGGAALASEEFVTQAGPAADGALLMFPQDPKSRPAAASLLRQLRAKGIEPDAYVFYAYAAVQVMQQAAAAAKSLDPAALAAAMHDGRAFATVLGDLAFDAKGDPTTRDYTVYVWHKGATGRMTFDDQAKT